MSNKVNTEPAAAGEALPIDKAELRRAQEIEFYRNYENVHDLPKIYTYWKHKYVTPNFRACGFASLDELFLRYYLDACRAPRGGTAQFTSLGAGNCDLEIGWAIRIREAGYDDFHFHCVEFNEYMIERGRSLAREQGLESRFSFGLYDVEAWDPETDLDICVASHSLHHIVELESTFSKVKEALGSQGVFLTNDMVGRNGHLRWPEALVHIRRIWNHLPRRYKYNHLLKRVEDEFVNWDCSTEGNEGIRSQDILPLLLESFHFEVCLTFGNLIDVFVDRCFGHNFDPDSEEDCAWIDAIAQLDEAKLDAGEVKPTHLVAAMKTVPVPMTCYKHWTPEFCVRSTELDDLPRPTGLPRSRRPSGDSEPTMGLARAAGEGRPPPVRAGGR